MSALTVTGARLDGGATGLRAVNGVITADFATFPPAGRPRWAPSSTSPSSARSPDRLTHAVTFPTVVGQRCGERQTRAMSTTVVASANILYKLPKHDARTALTQVLEDRPDLVGLQEWYVSRLGLLRGFGAVCLVPSLGTRLLRRPPHPAYHWVSAVGGGNVVGARDDRFEPLSARSVFLSRIGRSDRPDRFLRTEPPREVTIGVFRDRTANRIIQFPHPDLLEAFADFDPSYLDPEHVPGSAGL